MFTMAKIKDTFTVSGAIGKSNYLDSHLIHNDYYSEKGKVAGEWCGELAEALGLKGVEIKEGDSVFEDLRKNINPITKKKLTIRNREGGIRFFDFQCSAQKSVSILAVTMGDDRLREAHKKAFDIAVKEIEKFAAKRDNSEKGKLKEPIQTGNIIAGVFHHDASRSLDPQIHTHCVIANATYDKKNNQICSLQESNMVKAIRYAGKVYQNELAKNVRRCGYNIENKINSKGHIEGFEIVGVSEEIQKKFSKRRTVIDEEIEKFKKVYGRKPTTEEINIITKESRDKKLTEITTEEVIKGQLEQLSEKELKQLKNLKKTALEKSLNRNNIGMLNSQQLDETINYSIGHLFSRDSVLKGNQILAESLNQGLGYIDLDELKNVILINQETLIIKENNKDFLSDDITTLTGMQREIWAVEQINKTKNTMKPINYTYKAFSSKEDIELEKSGSRDYFEHRIVISEILQSQDQYISLRGVAGAGKTTSLTELRKGIKDIIDNVIFISPTTAGVDVLKKEGFDNAVTVENIKLTHHKLNLKNGLIIIDEAGLLSNVDGTEIMKIAEQNHARILFVGDTQQHKSVAAGDFLRILETHSDIQQLELNKIYRQRNKLYNKAATMLASGDVEGGILLLDTHEALGWVKEGKGKYKENAINDYLSFTENGKNLDDCIFVSTSNKECNDITLKLRECLKEKKIIDSLNNFTKPIFLSDNWTAQQKRSVKNYLKGMAILITQEHGEFKKNEIVCVEKTIKDKFNQNRIQLTDGRYLINSKYKNFEVGQEEKLEICKGEKIMARMPYKEITNGDIFTVTGLDKNENICTKEGVIIPKEYKSLKYGYVATSHKKQGSKAKCVVIAAEYLNRDSIYVAVTRGVHECRINVPDKELLYKQANILTERKAALDIATSDKLLNAKKSKIINKSDIIPRDSIWKKIKISTGYIKDKLLTLINESKSLDKARGELFAKRQVKIKDPFRQIEEQYKNEKNNSIEKNMDIEI